MDGKRKKGGDVRMGMRGKEKGWWGGEGLLYWLRGMDALGGRGILEKPR